MERAYQYSNSVGRNPYSVVDNGLLPFTPCETHIWQVGPDWLTTHMQIPVGEQTSAVEVRNYP